jgi:hypothetical protein
VNIFYVYYCKSISRKKESAKLSKLLLSEKHLQNEVAIEISPFHIYEWDFKERMSE